MKKVITYISLLLLFLLTSCGPGKGRFSISGHLLHINQGELIAYSPDGAIDGIDTIKIMGGRFSYEQAIDHEGIIVLVFPNFSEHPVFIQSGADISISADASHLKEMEVDGTKDNELMTDFRHNISTATPPETRSLAEKFVRRHPDSYVGLWLVRYYFVACPNPDYQKASQLLALMKEHQGKSIYISRLSQQVEALRKVSVGKTLPDFSAIDINGHEQTAASLRQAPLAVISTWASWNFDSQNMQRALQDMQANSNGRLKVLSICVDATRRECRMALGNDSTSYPTICDGEMLGGALIQRLGLTSVPDNMVIQQGKIIAAGLDENALRQRLQPLL